LLQHEKEYKAQISLKKEYKLLQMKQQQVSQDELKTMKEFINKFLEAGYIRELKLLISLQVMFVPKKDGTPRIVIDYQQLNNATEEDTNKAPHQKQKRDLLQGAKIMTVFDVK
ncbi:hypothetical protein M432DRAFT_553653, partial [Thermoascus aurantiacus ATCC 26904]